MATSAAPAITPKPSREMKMPKDDAPAAFRPAVDFSLADDLLKGADAIGAFLGANRRRVFYLLELGLIPCGKEGNVWICSKSALRAQYAKLTAGTQGMGQA
jgi:hypothetical protein